MEVPLRNRAGLKIAATIVSPEDYENVIKFPWRFYNWKGSKYAIGNDGNLSHFIVGKPPPGHVVDHINHNGLDNRRENLRTVTMSFNSQNKRKRPSASRYRGVKRSRYRTKWSASCAAIELGTYDTEEEAAAAYDRAALHRWGPAAQTNGLAHDAKEPQPLRNRQLPRGIVLEYGKYVAIRRGKQLYRGFDLEQAVEAHTEAIASEKQEKMQELLSRPIERNGDGVAVIPLGNGVHTMVDDSDYYTLMTRRWWKSAYGYAAGRLGLMHRVLQEGAIVDHRDGNRLNNQRANLRAVTASENSQNRRRVQNESGYLGVSRNGQSWQARIKCQRKTYFLGNFRLAEEAAKAYDKKAKELYTAPMVNFT